MTVFCDSALLDLGGVIDQVTCVKASNSSTTSRRSPRRSRSHSPPLTVPDGNRPLSRRPCRGCEASSSEGREIPGIRGNEHDQRWASSLPSIEPAVSPTGPVIQRPPIPPKVETCRSSGSFIVASHCLHRSLLSGGFGIENRDSHGGESTNAWDSQCWRDVDRDAVSQIYS
jgi:hypothetical protein